MDESTAPSADTSPAARRWGPLNRIERRVLGVMIEKAKTTPENYPLSLNAIRVGSCQKSNRAPQMTLSDDQVDEALDSLRQRGAALEVQGDGRVPKYRHMAYEWLGVDKVELAIMAELLLRGDQTIGELRGRAGRMEPIADLAALRPLLAALREKELIVYLTPEGRGCVVTHTLYRPQELDKLRAQYSGAGVPEISNDSSSPAASDAPDIRQEISELRSEIKTLRAEVAALKTLVQTNS